MKPTIEIPDSPALPRLPAIRVPPSVTWDRDLAAISRIGIRKPRLWPEAARTEVAFRTGTRGNERSLKWYRAAALLRLASKPVEPAGDACLRAKGKSDPRTVARARALALLRESSRFLEGLP